jgi:TPR repeat protein
MLPLDEQCCIFSEILRKNPLQASFELSSAWPKNSLTSMKLVWSLAWCRQLATTIFVATLLVLAFATAQETKEKRPSIKQVQAGANGGDPKMQNELGLRYTKAEDKLPRDFKLAAEWFRKASDQGLPSAQHNLAGLYFYGTGLPLDYQQALSWYRKAADQGSAPSQSFLGWMFLNGKGVESDYKEAMKWYRKAADQGDMEAQYSVGLMYYNGENLTPDFVEAYKWINLAAAQGHTNAIKQRIKLAEALTSEELAEAQKRSSAFKATPAK